MTSRTPTASGARLAAVLRPLLDEVVQATGYDLDHVAVTRAGRRNVVRVVVDADGGVSLDDITAVTRVVSAALDGLTGAAEASSGAGPAGADVLGAYTLEVSSPGVDRPLTSPRHWRRAIGRLVRTRVGDRPLEGRIVGADAAGVSLESAGTRRVVGYAELGPGAVQVEFAPPPTSPPKPQPATDPPS